MKHHLWRRSRNAYISPILAVSCFRDATLYQGQENWSDFMERFNPFRGHGRLKTWTEIQLPAGQHQFTQVIQPVLQ